MEYTQQLLGQFQLIGNEAIKEACYIETEEYRNNFLKAIDESPDPRMQQLITDNTIQQAQKAGSASLIALSAAAGLNLELFQECLKIAMGGTTNTSQPRSWYTMQSPYASEGLAKLIEATRLGISVDGFHQIFPDAVIIPSPDAPIFFYQETPTMESDGGFKVPAPRHTCPMDHVIRKAANGIIYFAGFMPHTN